MEKENLIVGIIFLGMGLAFFLNNENMAKGAANFYQKFYKQENLKIMFRIAGFILFLGGLAMLFLK